MQINPLAGASRRTRRAVLAAAIPAALAVTALPSSAEAATAAVVNASPNGVLTYSADTGESNNVRISAAPGKVVIDDVVPIRAGAGCSLINGNAECRVDVDSVSVVLRDRNDVIQYVAPHRASISGEDGNDLFFGGIRNGVGVGPIQPAFFFGGPGLSDKITYSAAAAPTNVSLDNVTNDGLTRQDGVNGDIEIIEGSDFDDTLTGSNQDKTERLIGGRGLDSMSGLGGNDIFEEGFASNGADNFFGGNGVDRVSYADRAVAVDVRLDGQRNDGQTGEFDFAGNDVEQLVGGRGGDLLLGNSAANKFFGGPGNDSLLGVDNGDFLSGGSGQDNLFGQGGSDVLEAKDGEADFAVDCGTENDIGNHDAFEQRVAGCESGDIGKLRLTPANVDAETGATERLRLSWKHPKSWRQLRAIELRLTQDELPVGEITIRPRRDRIDADGAVALVRGTLSRRGKTAVARLAIRLDESVAGQTLEAEVEAVDIRGKRQLERGVAIVRVAD